MRSIFSPSPVDIVVRYRHRFFDQVGYETMFASSGNKHFYLDNVTVRRTKIMNNVLDHLKILIFKVIF